MELKSPKSSNIYFHQKLPAVYQILNQKQLSIYYIISYFEKRRKDTLKQTINNSSQRLRHSVLEIGHRGRSCNAA